MVTVGVIEMQARPHLLGVLAGLFLAAGLVLASLIVARAWQRVAEAQAISVTGSASNLPRILPRLVMAN